MTGLKTVFKELNEREKLKVEFGNGKELQVKGKGTVGIETHHGNRILTNVQYVPDIGYNLLSVGQLMESRHSILFDNVSNVENFALTATATNTTKNNSELWHLRELTTPYTPEQNGVAERKNRTVVEMARSMLQIKGLSNDFWAEAVSTSIYLLNISPTKAVMNKTPFEAWYGKNPIAPSTPQSYHSPSSNDETSNELPSQMFRSMEDIYNSSQFALMVSDPMCYDEAASKEEWQQAMKE
ncbi:Integrase, catalytic core [Cucumis melo var. makuwa]|uniref:Integrase, catalytic core n=1 Tax=Cucumis melo var. makuwa TaxID=1194695 RepID=A0A5D3DZU2_CUCMM|nr:Integrase, catalytic core [Cucumis melo var. makuwa]TYK29034.1 Integrase, catalytic core [Cucumis melo var. makuwa]